MTHRLVRGTVVAALLLPLMASAQELALKSGESGDLFGVYWIANCKSILKRFIGVDVLGGPAGVEASLREEPVVARRQGCAEKVPGATVILTAKDVPAAYEGTVRVRVRYDTEEGDRQSLHSVKLLLFPAR